VYQVVSLRHCATAKNTSCCEVFIQSILSGSPVLKTPSWARNVSRAVPVGGGSASGLSHRSVSASGFRSTLAGGRPITLTEQPGNANPRLLFPLTVPAVSLQSLAGGFIRLRAISASTLALDQVRCWEHYATLECALADFFCGWLRLDRCCRKP